MNGKDIFLGLRYVEAEFIEEAEFGKFSSRASQTETTKRRIAFRRPFLVAAIIALMLLLVGCGVVYVLKMESLKIGETTQEQYVFATDGMSIIGTETVAQNVLTLAGLEGSAPYKANAEWYAYKEELLDSLNKMGEAGQLLEDYWQSGDYQDKLSAKAEELAQKYQLKPEGQKLAFRTTRNLCDALGVERFQTTEEAVAVSVKDGGCYDNGSFWMNVDFAFQDGQEYDVPNTWGILRWNRTDAFNRDYILLSDTGDWKEWNYTTSSGNEVLILCSPSDWRGYILSDRGDALMSLQVEYRVDLGNNVDGKTWWDYLYMTDRQMELVADSIDFSIQPKVVTQEDVDRQAAISASATQNGYTLTLKSVETDGYVARILVGVTAPEGVDLESMDIGTGFNPDEFQPAMEEAWGNGGFNDVPDSDGKANTKDLLMVADLYLEDDTMPFAPGSVWKLHIIDLWVDAYTENERLLTEGEWAFDIIFGTDNGDYREVELLSEPIQAKACTGWTMTGEDVLDEFTVTSFKLRKFSTDIEWERVSENYKDAENQYHDYADFFGWVDDISYRSAYIAMKDGTEVDLPFYDDVIDLDQVAFVALADGTILPMPGVAEETVRALSSKTDAAAGPVFEDGVELLTQPIIMKSLAGYVTGPDGIDEPLYEELEMSSVILHPSGIAIVGPGAFDSPDTQAAVVMRDGSEILLTGLGGSPYSGRSMSRLETENTIDLDQVDHVRLPDGTKLTMP